LDGTTNFAHGHTQWCVSVAWAANGEVQTGVIFDPMRGEMFAASRGRGATLNGEAIRVSSVERLDDSLVATGFPYDRRERADFYMPFYKAAVVATQGVRRAGAAALDLAWTACGRHDAYFEFGIQPWDVAAGTLLVTEAGGRVSDLKGGPHALDGRNTLASNGRLHDETVRLLANAWPK
ncbi:MAG TPA: inositol monophosphatase family protein, partial [bacterium]|nr:inositol monophosphatase family protein [bacterium]